MDEIPFVVLGNDERIGLHPKDGTIAKVNSSPRNGGTLMAKGGESSDGTRTGS